LINLVESSLALLELSSSLLMIKDIRLINWTKTFRNATANAIYAR
jgi:hypothetical protein